MPSTECARQTPGRLIDTLDFFFWGVSPPLNLRPIVLRLKSMTRGQVVMQEAVSPAQPLTEEACAGDEQNAAEWAPVEKGPGELRLSFGAHLGGKGSWTLSLERRSPG